MSSLSQRKKNLSLACIQYNNRQISIISRLRFEMPQQFSISTQFNPQAWNPAIFFFFLPLSYPRLSPSESFSNISEVCPYLQYVCHQLALCIKVPLCWDATAQRKRCCHSSGTSLVLRDKVKQITALFDAAAVLQIAFKWKLSLREYRAPWTIDQSRPCTFRTLLLQPRTPSPLWEPLYSEFFPSL